MGFFFFFRDLGFFGGVGFILGKFRIFFGWFLSILGFPEPSPPLPIPFFPAVDDPTLLEFEEFPAQAPSGKAKNSEFLTLSSPSRRIFLGFD